MLSYFVDDHSIWGKVRAQRGTELTALCWTLARKRLPGSGAEETRLPSAVRVHAHTQAHAHTRTVPWSQGMTTGQPSCVLSATVFRSL